MLGDCNFDNKTLCNWQNDKHVDHFDWIVREGSTPSSNTGPTSDSSGTERITTLKHCNRVVSLP